MTPEQIFTTRFKQLGALIASGSSEELIDLTLILRQFLVDGLPLVHQVNRNYRINLSFIVGLSVRERVAEMTSLGLPVPDTFLLAVPPPNEPKRQVNLDQLLAHEVVKIRDNYYSAHQLLNACANKMGGVHFDAKGANHEIVRDLGDLGRFLKQRGLGSAFSVLVFLARATYTGLGPLHDAVKKV